MPKKRNICIMKRMYMGMLMPKKRNICILEQLKEAREIVNTVDETTEKRVMHGQGPFEGRQRCEDGYLYKCLINATL
jgi:hypothetical protein